VIIRNPNAEDFAYVIPMILIFLLVRWPLVSQGNQPYFLSFISVMYLMKSPFSFPFSGNKKGVKENLSAAVFDMVKRNSVDHFANRPIESPFRGSRPAFVLFRICISRNARHFSAANHQQNFFNFMLRLI
jgi:hypothetical protein